jgi:hypothetical protein
MTLYLQMIYNFVSFVIELICFPIELPVSNFPKIHAQQCWNYCR